VDRTSPNGRVLGIDIIPAQPPMGVSTIQGNFLSRPVQDEVKRFLRDSERGSPHFSSASAAKFHGVDMTESAIRAPSADYLNLENRVEPEIMLRSGDIHEERKEYGSAGGRVVDVVLSDMSAPWEMIDGYWKRSLSDPYFRMMNTSGITFKDHAGSMVCSTSFPIMDSL
jgi:21S rRNA (uridine2791-2'-O)-methyltransferase